MIGWEPTRVLVLSQVALSFGLPFAILPLAYFTSKASIMGELVNRRYTTVAAWAITAMVLVLNAYLLYVTIFGGHL
jgi:manganese transport protein